MKYVVFLRTSKKFGKDPIEDSNCEITIKSLLQSFKADEIVVICDNDTNEKFRKISEYFPIVYKTRMGNSGSFRLCIELTRIHKGDVYYFVEDDHLHLPRQKEWLEAGLKLFDFVSLYDHPDKYYLGMYKELTRKIYLTRVGYFTSTPSTVMTFACLKETLKKAKTILLDDMCTGRSLNFPRDHFLFSKLRESGFTLGSPIPGRSTHCEKHELSPYVDWRKYIRNLS